MLKLLTMLAAEPTPTVDEMLRKAHLLYVWFAVVILLHFIAVVVYALRYQRLRERVEGALGTLAQGGAADIREKDEIGRVLRKVEARHALLQREASDARFDLRAIIA